MRRTMLKSKIHRATVTDTNLDYEGSLTIDSDLLEASDIVANEQIHVWDVTNGTRLITYAIPGDRGSGIIRVNGAGAHLIQTGDIVIIATFTELKFKNAKQVKKYNPKVVFVDGQNVIKTAELPAVAVDTEPAVERLPPIETNGVTIKVKSKKVKV